MQTRDDCIAMDRADGLAHLRGEFALPEKVIYLDGNSLGARPRQALARAEDVVARQWGHGLIGSWNTAGWFNLPARLGGRLAALIGAAPEDVVVTDSTSVNLFKALAGALAIQAGRAATAGRKTIVTERDNFPSDIYIAQGLTQWLDQSYRLRLVDSPDDLYAAIDQDTAAVVLTHVNYRSGYLLDMQALTTHAHDQGALVIWDLAHSAGAVPVDLTGCDADMAIGCTYKYLNGGPGAPAFIWIAPRHQDAFASPLSGWWAHAQPFDMQPGYVPATGIRKALCGTQPIVSMALIEAGLDIFAQTSMAAIRAKSLALTDLFIDLIDGRCASHPIEIVTPREHGRRGSHVSMTHPQGYAIVQALIQRGVIGDYREPRIMRFGFTPLYTRYVDAWDAVETLVRILDSDTLEASPQRLAVT